MLDQWYDFWRLGIGLVACLCMAILQWNWLKRRKTWRRFDRDRWLAMMAWSFAALELQVEGLVRDTPFRCRLVFVSIAILITLRLLTRNYENDD